MLLLTYDTAIQIKPDYAEAYYYRGHVNKDIGKYEDAFFRL